MTQKSNQFKGQQKKKTVALNRHGKAVQTRKGRRYMKPSKTTKELDTDRELTKFINHCNEVKAANAACKEGGQLNILKAESQAEPSKKKSAK
ncbi:2,3-bisphosphoglycerate-dependent phosphoglycerate mutase [Hirschfeldia incana]|nr:2,3-bisphosphoglycerate-dependent phosphoglycerate mutase [Hirschfeldia incana]